jgi:hypothetical protein
VVAVELPNKTVALVRLAEVEVAGTPAATKVGWPDRFDLKAVAGTLEGGSGPPGVWVP